MAEINELAKNIEIKARDVYYSFARSEIKDKHKKTKEFLEEVFDGLNIVTEGQLWRESLSEAFLISLNQISPEMKQHLPNGVRIQFIPLEVSGKKKRGIFLLRSGIALEEEAVAECVALEKEGKHKIESFNMQSFSSAETQFSQEQIVLGISLFAQQIIKERGK